MLGPKGKHRAGFSALLGLWRGRVKIADDFDEIPDDLGMPHDPEADFAFQRERAGRELLAMPPPPGDGPESDWEDQKREMLDERMRKYPAFRNVDASPDDPVSEWPQEGIQDALERGGPTHWRRLAEAVQVEPWGPVARRLEEVLSYSRPYGVAKAMERVVADARAAAEAAERRAVAAEISRLVDESGLTRAEFASRIGTSASRLSTYATGKVTPSASLLLRMRDVAEREPGR